VVVYKQILQDKKRENKGKSFSMQENAEGVMIACGTWLTPVVLNVVEIKTKNGERNTTLRNNHTQNQLPEKRNLRPTIQECSVLMDIIAIGILQTELA
jgi:hypothetical protein